jgi:hypothetical protein
MASVLRDLGLMASRADDAVLANTDLRAELDALSRSYDANRSVRAYAGRGRGAGGARAQRQRQGGRRLAGAATVNLEAGGELGR